jgi:hypothetical protein
MELFAGEGMITHAFASAGYQVAEPRDLLYGHDLSKLARQREVLQQIDELEPGLVFAGLDCRYWSTLSRVNYRTPDRKDLLQELRSTQEGMIRLVEKVFRRQVHAGRHAILENPDGSELWEHPVIKRVRAMNGVLEVRFDACQHGAKDSNGQFHIRKRTRLLVTHEAFVHSLGLRCKGEHEHLPLEGKETRLAAAYTKTFSGGGLRKSGRAGGTLRAHDGARECRGRPRDR